MTLEKTKRKYWSCPAFGCGKTGRRVARKAIWLQRRAERLAIKAGLMTKRTRFACGHCRAELRRSEWVLGNGGIIQCPKCGEETMDICFAARIELPRGKR